VFCLLNSKLALENEQRETALHYAAGSRRPECVEMLLAAKVDANAQDITGSTALIIASKQDDTDVMAVLIKYGADVNLADRQGRTALHWATVNKNLDCAALLIKARAELDKTDEQVCGCFVGVNVGYIIIIIIGFTSVFRCACTS